MKVVTNDPDGYNVNPFWNEVKIIPYERLERSDKHTALQSNSKDFELVVAKSTIRDKRNYVKVFNEGLIIFELPVNAQKVLKYIFDNHIRYNVDIFEFYIDSYIESENISRSVAYNAIKVLIDNRIIARKRSSKVHFYLNPRIAYKGDPVKGYKDWINGQKVSKADKLIPINKLTDVTVLNKEINAN